MDLHEISSKYPRFLEDDDSSLPGEALKLGLGNIAYEKYLIHNIYGYFEIIYESNDTSMMIPQHMSALFH